MLTLKTVHFTTCWSEKKKKKKKKWTSDNVQLIAVQSQVEFYL